MAIQRKPLLDKICPVCGDPFQTKRQEQVYDTLKCVAAARVEKQRAERLARDGGVLRYLDGGNWYIEVDGKRVAEHRYVYEQTHGVKLQSYHYIEWINGDKLDNRPENLRLANRFVDEYVRRYGKLPPRTRMRDRKTGRPMCVKHKCPKEAQSGRYKCRECEAERQRERRARAKVQRSSGQQAA